MNNFIQYALFILGFVCSFLGARNSYLEKKKQNIIDKKNNDGNRRSFFIIIAGIIISSSGGVLSTIKQKKAESRSIEEKKKYDSLTIALLNKQDELIGGDSIPMISIFFDPYMSGPTQEIDTSFMVTHFQVVNRGKYPIRGVSIHITDFQNHILAVINKDSVPDFSIRRDSLGWVMGTSNSSGLHATVRIDPNFKYDDMDKRISIGDLSPSAGYVDVYKGRILFSLGVFEYSIDLSWSNGSLHYQIFGIFEEKTKRIKIMDISPFVSRGINPFKYVDLLPQFVGGRLLSFPNPSR